MYKCKECSKEFELPKIKRTTKESYYGVSEEFIGSTDMILTLCPNCESEDIEEVEDGE